MKAADFNALGLLKQGTFQWFRDAKCVISGVQVCMIGPPLLQETAVLQPIDEIYSSSDPGDDWLPLTITWLFVVG